MEFEHLFPRFFLPVFIAIRFLPDMSIGFSARFFSQLEASVQGRLAGALAA